MKSTNTATEPSTERQCEWMSALADGQLQGDEFTQAMDALSNEGGAHDAWRTYHLIGDVLRAEKVSGSQAHDRAFLQAVQQRLAAEPVRPMAAQVPTEPIRQAAVPVPAKPAANDTAWRWKLVAGFASVAAVGVVGWNLAGPYLGNTPSAVLAQGGSPQTIRVMTPQGVLLRDPQLDDLLAAHKQYGGASALQTSTGFLRNATFDASAR